MYVIKQMHSDNKVYLYDADQALQVAQDYHDDIQEKNKAVHMTEPYLAGKNILNNAVKGFQQFLEIKLH